MGLTTVALTNSVTGKCGNMWQAFSFGFASRIALSPTSRAAFITWSRSILKDEQRNVGASEQPHHKVASVLLYAMFVMSWLQPQHAVVYPVAVLL